MSTEQKLKEQLLIAALRQYRHNDGEGFVFAYDKDSTEHLVAKLVECYDMQRFMKKKAREQRDAVTVMLADLVNTAEEIIRISDRKHDAWDAAKTAIAKAKGANGGRKYNQTGLNIGKERDLFESKLKGQANFERNIYHPEFYAHLPARMMWAAWMARAVLDEVSQ